MNRESEALEKVRKALRSVSRLGPAHQDIALAYKDGNLTIEGEVADVASKKLALEAAAAVPEVTGIVDRLRVRPAQPMGDRQILDHVRDALLDESALLDCAVLVWDKGESTAAREPDAASGRIEISVEDGVVTLTGEVKSLARKRLSSDEGIPRAVGSQMMVNPQLLKPGTETACRAFSSRAPDITS